MERIPQGYDQELYEKYADRVREFQNLDGDKFIEVQDKIGKFGYMLRNKYGKDIGRFSLFHALGYSTIDPVMGLTEDDLSGPDSIRAFIDGLYDEYKPYLPNQ